MKCTPESAFASAKGSAEGAAGVGWGRSSMGASPGLLSGGSNKPVQGEREPAPQLGTFLVVGEAAQQGRARDPKGRGSATTGTIPIRIDARLPMRHAPWPCLSTACVLVSIATPGRRPSSPGSSGGSSTSRSRPRVWMSSYSATRRSGGLAASVLNSATRKYGSIGSLASRSEYQFIGHSGRRDRRHLSPARNESNGMQSP